MEKLLREISTATENGEALMLLTVIADSGSVPRGAGARMLVGKNGRICGTIGGGAVEHRSEMLAVEALQDGKSTLKEFQLNKKDVENLGMVCGGNVRVCFHYISPEDKMLVSLWETALKQCHNRIESYLIIEFDGGIGLYAENIGLIGFEDEGLVSHLTEHFKSFEHGGKSYCAERLFSAGTVYVFGAGHISLELVPVLTHLDFRCIVADDRADFAKKEAFPTAAEVCLVDLYDIPLMKDIKAEDYIIALTRGHAFDQAVQEQALCTPAGYIGVIGSKSKRATVMDNMRAKGIDNEALARITSPIGLLNISAKTPAEIAISIAAQLIAFRAIGKVIS